MPHIDLIPLKHHYWPLRQLGAMDDAHAKVVVDTFAEAWMEWIWSTIRHVELILTLIIFCFAKTIIPGDFFTKPLTMNYVDD